MATKNKRTAKKIDMSDVVMPTDSVKVDLTKVTKGEKRTIPENALINVKSNVFGKLIFQSKRTGERIVWEKCGDVQQVPLAILRAIKAEALSFYRDQWVIIIGFADENGNEFVPADIYDQLFVTQYYKELVDPSNYEEICAMTPDEIKAKIPMMSDGAKANLAVALNTYIEKGVLDSVKAIKAFEEVLGCDLRDPD